MLYCFLFFCFSSKFSLIYHSFDLAFLQMSTFFFFTSVPFTHLEKQIVYLLFKQLRCLATKKNPWRDCERPNSNNLAYLLFSSLARYAICICVYVRDHKNKKEKWWQRLYSNMIYSQFVSSKYQKGAFCLCCFWIGSRHGNVIQRSPCASANRSNRNEDDGVILRRKLPR